MRQYATLILRRRYTKGKNWTKLSVPIRIEFKKIIIQVRNVCMVYIAWFKSQIFISLSLLGVFIIQLFDVFFKSSVCHTVVFFKI